MHVTLLLPGALVPREIARALAEPLAASALSPLLARAQLAGDSEAESPPHLAWLAEHLFQAEVPLATAPYAVASMAGQAPAPDQVMWHADPVHLEAARDHVALAPLDVPLPHDDADALVAAANDLAAEADAEFMRLGNRWFLRTARPWALHVQPLVAALDAPLHTVLPKGRDAAVWNRLLTELQMTWHGHPVNEAREARGDATVNSVWLHGGGRWAPLRRPAFAAVLADEPEWRGAAQAAGIVALPADAAPTEGALLVWSDLLVPRLRQDWTGWIAALRCLDARLASLARAGALDLVLTGEASVRRLQARPSDRLKFWRTASAEQALAE